MPQCPCAELFKIGDDYTLEHHPDCAAQVSPSPLSILSQLKRYESPSDTAFDELTREIADRITVRSASLEDYRISPGDLIATSDGEWSMIGIEVAYLLACRHCGARGMIKLDRKIEQYDAPAFCPFCGKGTTND